MKTLAEQIIDVVGKGFDVTFKAVENQPATRIIVSRDNAMMERYVLDSETEMYRGDLFAVTLESMTRGIMAPLSDAYFRSLRWENDSTANERVWTRIDAAYQARKSSRLPWVWIVRGKVVPSSESPQSISSALEKWPDHQERFGGVDYIVDLHKATGESSRPIGTVPHSAV